MMIGRVGDGRIELAISLRLTGRDDSLVLVWNLNYAMERARKKGQRLAFRIEELLAYDL